MDTERSAPLESDIEDLSGWADERVGLRKENLETPPEAEPVAPVPTEAGCETKSSDRAYDRIGPSRDQWSGGTGADFQHAAQHRPHLIVIGDHVASGAPLEIARGRSSVSEAPIPGIARRKSALPDACDEGRHESPYCPVPACIDTST